ncbi:MAG: alpha/beta hydrolase [Gammaproteobacteria bacterium]
MSDKYVKDNFEHDGIFVDYIKPGHEAPHPLGLPLLFIHGGFHGSWCWHYYLKYFATAGYECYALNWYNHYKSAALPMEQFVNRSIVDVTEEIDKIVDYLKLTPVIVGWSMGGLAALKYAEQSLLPGLVLITPGIPLEAGGAHIELPIPYDDQQPFSPPPFEIAKELFLQGVDEERAKHYYSLLCPESAKAVREVMDTGHAISVDKTKISHPILVLGAECDRLAPPDLVRNTADVYAADYIYIRGKGHNLLTECGWQETAELIVKWLRRMDMLSGARAYGL